MQVYTSVIPNTGQRSDIPNNTYAFWMINLASISLVTGGGNNSPVVLGTNLTAIVDSGTGPMKADIPPIKSVLMAYEVGGTTGSTAFFPCFAYLHREMSTTLKHCWLD
jgi:hypothetical protein